MKVKVTKDTVVITEYTSVNAGEKGLNVCAFQLSEEFSGLTVTAAFNNIPVPVCDGECIIPTLKKGNVVLGVYAYRETDDGVELMYSPKPTVFYVNEGSYTEEVAVEEIPTIGEYEKYCQMFAASLIEKAKGHEKLANKAQSIDEKSTHDQYPTAKAVYDELKEFKSVICLGKDDFVNGSFADKQGITASDYWIISPECVRVKIGDVIKIKPSEGFKVWWRIFNSSDLSVAANLLNGGVITDEIEYVSEFDGYFNAQVAKTDGRTIFPDEYDCSIIISSSRIRSLERELIELEGELPEVLDAVALAEEHTNKQVYGAAAMDEALRGIGKNQGGVNNKIFEQIATFTVIPDTDGSLPSSIVIDKDLDGNEFELTDIYCDVSMGLTDGNSGKFYIKAGNTALMGNFNPYFTNELRKWFFRYDSYGETLGGLCAAPTSSIKNTSAFPSNSVSTMLAQPVPVGKTVNINRLELTITVGTDKTFVEGTTITLWGVRK